MVLPRGGPRIDRSAEHRLIRMVYALDPAARSRLAGVLHGLLLGRQRGGVDRRPATYASAGWTGVCLLRAGISTVALAVWALSALGENHTEGAPALR